MFSATGAVSGTPKTLKLDVAVTLPAWGYGGNGNVYVVAKTPALGAFAKRSDGGWSAVVGTEVTSAVSNPAKSSWEISVLDGSVDATELVGTEIYAGYGVSFSDMLARKQYRRVYTFQ